MSKAESPESEVPESPAEPEPTLDPEVADEAPEASEPEPAGDNGVMDPERMNSMKDPDFGQDQPREAWDSTYGRPSPTELWDQELTS